MPDRRTVALYDAEAEGYADLTSNSGPYPRLEAFIDALPAGGRVLDLGCGPGTWAARMIERGLAVDALDASTGMAAVARNRHGIDVRIGTFDDVTGDACYDGIWAHFSLLHAPRDDMPRHLETLRRALKPSGRFLMSLKLGKGEARDGKDRLYTYYSEPEIDRLLEDAGIVITAREFGEDTGFDGTRHSYIVVHAGRR